MANNNKTYQQWWTATSDKVYQLLAHGRWFSPGTPASSTTKTGRHDIAEMLLKVALSTKNQSNQSTNNGGQNTAHKITDWATHLLQDEVILFFMYCILLLSFPMVVSCEVYSPQAEALFLTRQHYKKTGFEGEGNNMFST